MRTIILTSAVLCTLPLCAAAAKAPLVFHDNPFPIRASHAGVKPLPMPKSPPKYTPVHDTTIYCRFYGYSYSTNDFWGTPQAPVLYTRENTGYPPASSYPVKIGFDSDWDDEHGRGHVQFDLSVMPDSIQALSAGLRVISAIDTQWAHEWDSWTDVPIVLRGMWRDQAGYTPHDGDASSWELYDDAGDGSSYGTHNLSMDHTYNLAWPSPAAFYDLGSQAVADLNGSWASGWFGIGLAVPDESADRGINLWGAGSSLHLAYKYAKSHPRLSAPSVTPGTGEVGITSFTYAVSYVDSFGYPADSAFVIIDGVQRLALTATGDPIDCRYLAKTTLSAAGGHNYRFHFHNTYGRTANVPSTGALAGPAATLHPGPYVVRLRTSVVDTGSMGNGDGVLNSGETAKLRIWVRNFGSDPAQNVTGTITTGDPNLAVLTAIDTFGTIPSLDSAMQAGFTVAAMPSAPFNYTASLVLRCRDQGGHEWASSILLPLNALFFDDAEDSLALNFSQRDAPWHSSERVSYSPSHAWWCGDDSGGLYQNNANASLVTTEFLLGGDQQLSFWQQYQTEAGYDSCLVEITSDGGASWSRLDAFTGDGLPWSKRTYDLSSIPAGAPVRVRFRLTSDNSVTRQGWFLDDIRVGPASASLSNGALAPSIGDTTTLFAFSVTYTSAANAPPSDSSVVIDGIAHSMARAGGAYATGAQYSYAAKLPPGNTHTYLYYFTSDSQTLQHPSSGYLQGPWVGVTTFGDDFESGLSRWITGHRYNSLDWSLTSSAFHSASHALTDSRDSVYRDSTDAWAQTLDAFDLSPYAWAKLAWWEKYWTEDNYDFCNPEISADGGATWSALVPRYSGRDTMWHERVADLSPYCGKSAAVKFRFRFTSDLSIHYDGWYVDDVLLAGGWQTGIGQGRPEMGNGKWDMRMEQNFPNPFTMTTAISYQLTAASRINLTVYNITGQAVRTLADGMQPAGAHAITWDGRDRAGQRAATGIYFYRLATMGKSIAKKMIVLK